MGESNIEQLYFYIEEAYNIRLELGDKKRIDDVIREYNPTDVGSINHIILRTLIDFGYESEQLEKRNEEQEKWLERFAEYVYRKYGNQG
jgi:hypothetical protein